MVHVRAHFHRLMTLYGVLFLFISFSCSKSGSGNKINASPIDDSQENIFDGVSEAEESIGAAGGKVSIAEAKAIIPKEALSVTTKASLKKGKVGYSQASQDEIIAIHWKIDAKELKEEVGVTIKVDSIVNQEWLKIGVFDPETVKKYLSKGYQVIVEKGAGDAASFTDESFVKVGGTIESDTQKLWQESDIVLKVRAPVLHPQLNRHEADLLKDGATLISFLWPAQNPELLQKLSGSKKLNILAMDSVPRISRAQKIDALSSMANIAGYRAVIESAQCFGRFFTGQITAAGKVPPAKVLVIGAGVAGLSAIGTAKSLGAAVRAFDTRPEVKEQVQSMGAEFLELDFQEEGQGQGGYAKEMSKEFIEKEMALFRQQASEVDIIITTALIPGKKAPLLITEDMLEVMAEGSVVVDLAAEQGGNCAFTQKDQLVKHKGVTIIGYSDLPTRLPGQASRMYSNNIKNVIDELGASDKFQINMDDEMIRGMVVIHQGTVTWPPPKIEPSPIKAAPAKTETATKETGKKSGHSKGSSPEQVIKSTLFTVVLLLLIGMFAPPSFLTHLTVFVLSCFIGWQVIWNVTAALHTPLMSVTNAISGIIIVGGLLQAGKMDDFSLPTLLALVAIFVATINISGGFLVTQRMLKMFRREG